MRKDTVYDELLEGYQTLKHDMDERTAIIHSKIESAEKDIREKEEQISESMESGDPEKFIQLTEERQQLDITLRYYNKMADNLRKGAGLDSAECERLYQLASQEMDSICAEFNARFVELLAPLVQLSKEYKLRYDLAKLARVKIGSLDDRFDSYMLRNKHSRLGGTSDIYFMSMIDRILQSSEYTKCVNVGKDDYILSVSGKTYNWHAKEDSILSEESRRWR